MKMLFAVQATGNGHVSRAGEIIPYLKKHGELDVLLSGYQLDIDTGFEVKYRKKLYLWQCWGDRLLEDFQTPRQQNLSERDHLLSYRKI
jgi:hypothetical protein